MPDANLKVLDGDGNPKYLKETGGGTNLDPHIAHTVIESGAVTETNSGAIKTDEDAIAAVAGTTAGAKVITDANGTLQQYLRGLVYLLISKITVILNDLSAANAARSNTTPVLPTQLIDAAGNVFNVTAANTGRSTATLVFPIQIVDAAGNVVNVTAANTARTNGTLVLPVQTVDAAGNVLGRTAANTARTTGTLVDPVQLVDAAGNVFNVTAANTARSTATLTLPVQVVDAAGNVLSATPVLGASEALIGHTSGYKKSASVEFTRPADTTNYTANDCVGVSLAVTGATNASPIVITCATHSLADGDPVTVSGVGGNTNANVSAFAKVTGYSTTTFGMYSDKALTTPIAGNSNYTTGGAVARLLRFVNMARIAQQNGYVVKAQIATDLKTDTKRYKLHLFSTPTTAILDNVAYGMMWANRTLRSGQIVFPVMSTEDSTASDSALALAVPDGSGNNLPLYFSTGASDQDMYGMLETLDAGTDPTTQKSAQTFYIRLSCEDD